ncbi:MetQ/NlpA family ABC transporter substrate-binding protein [Timonella senegalensis]|jgi:D-methionine transport system substrate-binding protein|uniref:MetQ/NlpA family ABC transporter substrate-binding protein n=1 Tax=Timonella senegalensis TaxID=1465825 RepID=UPI00031C86BC|nr:MetQ/NlpA family ABC transporter substrate-binding protein [Timonella senegalensis]
MSRKSVLKSVAAAALTATLAFSLSACGADDKGSAEEGADTKGTKENPVTIGVVGAEDYWATFETEAEKQGLFVDIKDLGDYQLPNKAVTAGELDLNQFQHLLFLANYNVDANEDLTPIAGTAVYPLGVYSKKHTSVDSITGGEVAVPNDPTNLSRALLVLQDAGLIKLKDGGSAFSTELDVLPESKVKVTPVDATQTVLALDSVEASVVNNDFLADAGLKATDAIYKDSAEAEGARPYINIWVTRAEDKDNAVYKKVIDVYKSQTVQDGVLAASGGTAAFANQSGEELTGFLKDIEEQIKASK